jgi:hypothetical protein
MGRDSIYWSVVLLTFFYIISKNSNSSIKLLIILCFYSGLAGFFGTVFENIYKIVLVIFSIYILLKSNGLTGLNKKDGFLILIFVLFSISFIYSAFINGDYFNLVFSQYGKYTTPICGFFILNRIQTRNPGIFVNLKYLFFSLLTIQIILSFLKILILGMGESIVGSVSFIGGGLATILPVLGFILLWLDKHGDFKRKEWYYIFLLLFIGFASMKRAIWFIMPVIILLFMYYVPRKLKVRNVLYFIPIISIIFYIGVRLSPTLNSEGRVGGKFDLKYVIDYTQKYSFGKTSETSNVQLGEGRGGATLLLWEKLFNGQPLSFNDFWGFGLREIYTTDYDQFDNEKFGVNGKGSVTGIFQSYIFSGYIGVFITVLFIISILGLIKEPRIRITIALLMFWDYLFYSGLILRSQSLFILLFFIIIYSNLQFEQKLYQKYSNLKLDYKNKNLQFHPV